MKNSVLKNIDKIKGERNISKEAGKKIFYRAIINFTIGISIIILLMAFYIISNYLSKDISTLVYNISASTLLIATLIIIEIAYKKDSGKLAITSVEMIVLSIYALFAKSIFLYKIYKYIYGFIALTTIYYTFKIIRIYLLEKKKFLTEISDITDIIKKESKDELAEQEKEKRKEEQRKLIEERAKAKKIAKRKTTKKKTETVAKKKTSKNTTTKKTTIKKDETAKKEEKETKKKVAKKTANKENEKTEKKATKKTGTKTKKIETVDRAKAKETTEKKPVEKNEIEIKKTTPKKEKIEQGE